MNKPLYPVVALAALLCLSCGNLITDMRASIQAGPDFAIVYDANGATSGTVPMDTARYYDGTAVKVQGNSGGLAMSGSSFAGWMTALDGSGESYAADATLIVGGKSLVLYAIWIPDTFIFTSAGRSVTIMGYRVNAPASLSIPPGVTDIGSQAFNNQLLIYFNVVTSVSLPPGLKGIGEYAFAYWGGLTSISLPEGITKLSDFIFFHCGSLANVKLPVGLRSIGDSAFRDCGSLKNINLPTGLTSIGDRAFENSGLTSLILPAGLQTIRSYAFMHCMSLSSLRLLATKPPALGSDVFSSIPNLTTIHVPKGSEGLYQATWWSHFAIVSP